MIKKTFLLSTLLAAGLTYGQDDSVEEVVVTGIRASGDYYDMPAITIKKQGDFIIQNVKIINDSRDKSLRQKEIRETLQQLTNAAKKQGDIELSFGEDFLRALDPEDKTLAFLEDKTKTDTSYLKFSVKRKVNPKVSAATQEAALEHFIKSSKKVGRTEIEMNGDTDLSIVNPEKYRYEVIQTIVEENARLRQAVGEKCSINLDGLGNRVQWQRSGITELVIYIPYRTQLSCQ